MEVGAALFALVMMLFMGLAVVTAVVLGVGGTVLWLWMLIDCLLHEEGSGNEKILWAVVILLANFLGAVLYFVIRRQPRRAVDAHDTIERYHAG